MNDSGHSPLLGLSQRLPPCNIQAEQALLGAILANNRAYDRVVDFLEPKHFADPVHAAIYRRITERILDGRVADAVAMKNDFSESGVLGEAGGAAYLATLLTAMVGILNAGEYGRAIYDAWLRRELIGIGEGVVNNAFGADQALDGKQQIEAAERALSALSEGGGRRDRTVSIGEAVHAAVAQADAIYRGGPSPAVMTGIGAVDAAIGGLWPGNFIMLAGIPGAGKTSLAVQIGDSLAQREHDRALRSGLPVEEAQRQPGVSVFSLEMSAEELAQRVAAYRANISVQKLLEGKLDMASAVELARAERETAHLPFRIHDCRAISVRLLAAKVRMHLQRQPELLIIVDHLLVLDNESRDGRQSSGNDAANVAKAARDLKQLARDTGLPFLVLTHATRASAARTNPRPMKSDVKWSGEGDADTLFFVHRPVMFMDSEPPPRGLKEGEEAYDKRRGRWRAERDRVTELAELVVAKRRMGPEGVYRMRFHGPTTSFHPWIGE